MISNEIYKYITKSGVAVELENLIWVDKDGSEVNRSQSVVLKNMYFLIHPAYTLC